MSLIVGIYNTVDVKKAVVRYPLLALVAVSAIAGVAAMTTAVSTGSVTIDPIQNAHAMRCVWGVFITLGGDVIEDNSCGGP